MARRKHTLIEALIETAGTLPWWAGVALAIAAYLGLHGVATGELTAAAQSGKLDEFVGQNRVRTLAGAGQYGLPLFFLAASALSAYGRHTRSTRHQQDPAGPDRGALNAMSWRQFEKLVAEAFRRKGYSVTETGTGGTDGGVDLVLKKGGATFLVQCKQWRAIKVGVNPVRELHGLMTSRDAAGGFVLTSGVFTDEACAFARGKNIELMDGRTLNELLHGVSLPVRFLRDPLSVLTTGAPFCPVCQSRMIKLKARNGTNAGKSFWRCSRYPDCSGKRPA